MMALIALSGCAGISANQDNPLTQNRAHPYYADQL